MYRILTAFFFMCFYGCLSGASTTDIFADFQMQDIADFGRYYPTSDQELSIVDIQNLSPKVFRPLSQTDGSFYTGDSVIWVRISLHNPTSHNRELLLEVRDVRINELQFFTFQDGLLIDSSQVTGDYHPFNQRNLYHPFYLYPVHLAQNATQDLFICYKKIGETITLTTQLWDNDVFWQEDRDQSFVFNLFLGALLCITSIVSLVAFVSRRKLLLSFALYCLACLLMVLLMTGYGFMYIWPNYPYWNGLGYFFVLLYYLSMIQMTKIYMETKKFVPIFHQFFSVAQALLLFVFAPLILLHWFLPSTVKLIVGRAGILLLLTITASIVLSSLLVIWKKRSWGSVFFLLGFSFTLLAVVLFEIEQIGAQNTLWGTESTIVFILLDFLILLAVFSNQIRQTFLRNAELKQALTETQLSAANALLEGQQEERQRLSRELHDGISIQLALLKMSLSQLFSQKTKEEKTILNSVSDIAKDIRSFTHAIAPLDLERQTLEEAIEDLIFRLKNQVELEIDWEATDLNEETIPPSIKHAIFQSLQELFNNTIKYAAASKVAVGIRQTERIQLVFQDNGVGFDTSKITGGLGLRNIKARAELLNGSFEMTSSSDGSQFNLSLNISSSVSEHKLN